MKERRLLVAILLTLALCLIGCGESSKGGDSSQFSAADSGNYGHADYDEDDYDGDDYDGDDYDEDDYAGYDYDSDGDGIDDGYYYDADGDGLNDYYDYYDADGDGLNDYYDYYDADGDGLNGYYNYYDADGDGYYDDDCYGGDYYDDDYYGQNMQGTHSNDVLSLSVYKINDDVIHVRISDNDNTGVMGGDVDQLVVRIADNDGLMIALILLDPNYAELSYCTNDRTDWHTADYYENVGINANMAGATFGGRNIACDIWEGMEYSIELYKYGSYSDPLYGVGRVDPIQVISENEITEIVSEGSSEFSPTNKAHDIWAGEYLCHVDYYDDNHDYVEEYGVVVISNTEKGAIKVDLTHGKEKRIYYLQEDTYEEDKPKDDYSWIREIEGFEWEIEKERYEDLLFNNVNVTEGVASLPGGDLSNDAELRYTKEADGIAELYLDIMFMEDGQPGGRKYELYPIRSSETVAPADFTDTDKYGYIEAILKDKNNYLYPSTDNYIFEVSPTGEIIYDSSIRRQVDYRAVEVTLYEFDANDLCINTRSVATYESPEAASAVYSYWRKLIADGDEDHSLDGCELKGNEMIFADTEGSHYGRRNYTKNFEAYDGMHYAESKYSSADTRYIYSSKPFDSSKSIPGVDLLRTMLSVPGGTYNGVGSKRAYMSLEVSGGWSRGAEIKYTLYGDDFRMEDFYAVYDGPAAYIVTYEGEYKGNDYVNYVCIDEIVFGEEETIATRNKYRVDDYSNVTITIDNYRSRTPDSVEVQRYDMTKTTK